MVTYTDIDIEELNKLIELAYVAGKSYSKTSPAERKLLLYKIAEEIEALGEELITIAGEETNLSAARLRAEKARTLFQLQSYADAGERGQWMQVRIDNRATDLRKMMIPIGPVAVFGAANFPFAYSTAGGDTATALAAGCSVIVKAHPAHSRTSELVAGAVHTAIKKMNLPPHIFIHVHGKSNEVGENIVKHARIKAVGFTGSFAGGKQLFDWAAGRKEPIPVFAEMSSVNPVFIFPEKLGEDPAGVARTLVDSITLGAGQFCTNPGVMIIVKSESVSTFKNALIGELKDKTPEQMLHLGIYSNYVEKRANILAQEGVEILGTAAVEASLNEAQPTVAITSAATFLNNSLLQEEVFGPFSLLVECEDVNELEQVAMNIAGQLTTSLFATESEYKQYSDVAAVLYTKAGRVIYNGVPTGVEVALAMNHGGPFPATTDSRYTAVGADGISRFVRPITYQNHPESLLSPALQNANPWNLYRTVNDMVTDKPL